MALSKKSKLILATFTSDPNLSLEDAVRKVGGVSEARIPITACELRYDDEFVKAMERKTTQKLEALERKDSKPPDAAEVINTLREIDADCRAQGAVAWAVQARIRCAELLGKNAGMFAERVELSYGAELAKALAEARERRKLLELPTIEGKLADN